MCDLISVLVITYNSEQTVIETLNSIKKQDYENIEIVVSDDNSNDRTIKIVTKWLKKEYGKDNYTIVQSHINTGVPGNCNRGIKKCNGKYVKIIAGDDILFQNAISTYYKFVQTHNSNAICVAGLKTFGVDMVYAKQIEDLISRKNAKLAKSTDQFKALMRENLVPAPSIGLLSIEIIKKAGGFNEAYPAFEDYPFFFKLSSLGYKYILIEEPLVGYRISEKSITCRKDNFLYNSERKFFWDIRAGWLLKKRKWIVLLKQMIRFRKQQ